LIEPPLDRKEHEGVVQKRTQSTDDLRLEAAFLGKSKRTAPSRDRNRDLRITCIAAIPRSTTELKKLVVGVSDHCTKCYIRFIWGRSFAKLIEDENVDFREADNKSICQGRRRCYDVVSADKNLRKASPSMAESHV
jgi:hypothetical protein